MYHSGNKWFHKRIDLCNVNDIILNQELLYTYGELIKNRKVIIEVDDELRLDLAIMNKKEKISLSHIYEVFSKFFAK